MQIVSWIGKTMKKLLQIPNTIVNIGVELQCFDNIYIYDDVKADLFTTGLWNI